MSVLVWDRAVRVLHWALVSALVLAALSVWVVTGAHRPAGYVALAIVLLRAVWGGVGRGHARFARFVRGPHATLRYIALLRRGRAPRHLGHNPLGGWMVLALMSCVCALALTGWLYTTDVFWGSEAVEDAHRTLAWTLLALVALHVAGVLVTGRRHRENLVAAIFSGRKRAAAGTDVA